ncbi:MAG: alpha-glucosidase C-terminal domain-containing protein, partial [Nitratireductor sp.]
RAAFEQDRDATSILNRNRAFYAWRQGHQPLRKGDMTFLDSDGETLVFTRTYQGETILCAFNLGAEPAEVTVPDLALENIGAPGFTGTIDGARISLNGLDAVFARAKR